MLHHLLCILDVFDTQKPCDKHDRNKKYFMNMINEVLFWGGGWV